MYKYYTTAFNPSGNRYVPTCNSNSSMLRSVSSFTYDHSDAIVWIVGNDLDVSFAVLDAQKQLSVMSFPNANQEMRQVKLFDDEVLPQQPLVAQINGTSNSLQPVIPPSNASTFSSAYPIQPMMDVTSATEHDGHLFVTKSWPRHLQQLDVDGNDVTHPDLSDVSATTLLDPLHDAQIVYSPTNQMWAMYTHATESRNTHCILGDCLEGYHLHILKRNADGQIEIASEIILEGDSLVFEGLSPFWADVNQDGIDDLVTTISGNNSGAALRVYFLPGGTLPNDPNDNFPYAQSSFIGLNNRWLHQLAFGPLGPNSEMEIVEIRTPHIEGIIRYYRLNPDDPTKLTLVATTASKYTSHTIGSRNVDMATVADLNGDGIPEIILQDQSGNAIFGLQRCGDDSVKEVWSVPIPQSITSNFGIACNSETNEAAVMIGYSGGGLLRISFGDAAYSGGDANPTNSPIMDATSMTPSSDSIDPRSCGNSSTTSGITGFAGGHLWLWVFAAWTIMKLFRHKK